MHEVPSRAWCALFRMPNYLLQNKGKYIAWKHVVELYQAGSGAQRDAPGLSIVPKLKYEHIVLTSFSKMHVNLVYFFLVRML